MLTLRIAQNTFFKATTDPSSSLAVTQKAFINAGKSLQIKSYQKKGKHYFVQLAESISPVGASGYFFHEHVQMEEIRGVWLANADSDILQSRENLRKGLAQLKALGFNTIYPVVWQRGFTLYPSEVAKNTFGASISPDPHFKDRDMLAELIEEAKPHGFRVIAWFEYGLMTPSNAMFTQTRSELLTEDRNGNKSLSDRNMCWLNPCQPEVREFISDLVAEVAQNYSIDGVQLDDHFAMPVEMGYDSFTLELFNQETGGADPLENPNSYLWKKWRMDKITDLLRKIFQSVKAKNADCILSISPNPLGFSQSKCLADWHIWEQEGLMEEMVLQVYRDDLSAFIDELNKSEVRNTRDRIPTVIGILTGLKDSCVPFATIEAQISETRNRDFAGVSFFFFGSLFAFGPEPASERLESFNGSLSHDVFV
ncbi:family 10 glycosylhydrolase [Tumidithrix elongata RA019]|uniref:Family 10 glycosylhydrolase n=1 Tax=Tumidithrix elongata BACA0141 TaxID=2716417 RepID=A0AAW9PQV1_9CYAN|nr:family 10 glycosylhydrolase [Tumidithrix elongata RA019]